MSAAAITLVEVGLLSLGSWAGLWPMLRAPRLVLVPARVTYDVPLATFDSGGMT